jgi:hypothetical protein
LADRRLVRRTLEPLMAALRAAISSRVISL